MLEHIGPGAHRMGHGVGAVGLNDFTRHRHHIGHGEKINEIEIRLAQLEGDGISVAHSDALDARVVIKFAVGFF